MRARVVIAAILITVGVVVLLWGGVFWTDRDQVVDAGPFQVATEEQKGVSIPPIVGGASIVLGVILLFVSRRSV